VPPTLLFFTDPIRTPHPENIIKRLPRGAGVVYRPFGARDALSQGRRLIRTARSRGVVFIVGADIRLAIALRADGVHLPERDVGKSHVQRLLRKRFFLTVAAHSVLAALKARRTSVDALIYSAVFTSRSRSEAKPVGEMGFAALVRRVRAPVFALGGINTRTAPRLGASGASGLAGIDGFTLNAP
jgi:thiamine-phosphate pyrophosphorylase